MGSAATSRRFRRLQLLLLLLGRRPGWEGRDALHVLKLRGGVAWGQKLWGSVTASSWVGLLSLLQLLLLLLLLLLPWYRKRPPQAPPPRLPRLPRLPRTPSLPRHRLLLLLPRLSL